ncbi:MAG: hypothetical protein IKE65_09730 [Clostridia bacterium]|nr:hypothetical protein [Clostridia bacterium]
MNKAPKKESIGRRHRYFLLFFGYLLVYHIVVVNHLQSWQLNPVTYSLYCVDFSFGFASKLLPGAVFHLLFGKFASQTAANIYAVVLILLFFLGLSLLLEKFMLRMPEQHRGKALFLLLFLLSGAYTFAIYTKWLGIYDGHWLLVALAYFVCLENKYLRFFIPALFAVSLFIHFAALVFVLPMFSILLLYRASIMEEKNEKRAIIVIFVLCMLCAAATFAILSLNESRMVCSIEEFHQKLGERGTDYYTFWDYAFFHLWGGEQFLPDAVLQMKPSLMKFVYLFYYQIKMNYGIFVQNPSRALLTTLGGTVVLCPVVWFFLRFHFSRFRAQKDRFKRFCTLLMIVQFPFVYILGILLGDSLDMTRYLTHGFLAMFTCVLCVLYHEKSSTELFFEQAGKRNSLALKIYFLAYAALTLMPTIH